MSTVVLTSQYILAHVLTSQINKHRVKPHQAHLTLRSKVAAGDWEGSDASMPLTWLDLVGGENPQGRQRTADGFSVGSEQADWWWVIMKSERGESVCGESSGQSPGAVAWASLFFI